MPADFVKSLALWIFLSRENAFVFCKRNRPMLAIFDFIPLPFRNYWTRKPSHIDCKIMQTTKENVCRYGSAFQCFQQVICSCLDQRLIPQKNESLIFCDAQPPLFG